MSLTLFDNNSTDGTLQVAQDYATRHPAIRIKRNRCNVGPVANIQRALWFGDADYIMPKTGDDLIAPDYIERLMGVLLAHPACAMCHAAGLVFTGVNQVSYRYPPEHWLQATGPDPVERARHVMQRYTSAPAFWGIYRRDAVDQLSTIRYRSGFDHAMLAELALYAARCAMFPKRYIGGAVAASRLCCWGAARPSRATVACRWMTCCRSSAGARR